MKGIRDGKLIRARRFVIGDPRDEDIWSKKLANLCWATPMTRGEALHALRDKRDYFPPNHVIYELVPRLDLGMSDGKGGIVKVEP